jgi:hypothetical protein
LLQDEFERTENVLLGLLARRQLEEKSVNIPRGDFANLLRAEEGKQMIPKMCQP